MATDDTSGETGYDWKKIGLGVAALAALIAIYSFLPVQEWSEALRDWIEGLGVLGWVVFVVIYAVGTVALLPGALLTLTAGLAFGLWGFPLVIVGATIGAGLAFLAGRHLARDWAKSKVEANDTLRAVDAAIESEGWKVVALLRLSPAVPFSLQNWVLGATSVAFWPYLIATGIAIMPGTLLYIWIGSLGGEAGGGTSTAKYAFLGVGIVATLAVTWLISRKAKQKLEEFGVDQDD